MTDVNCNNVQVQKLGRPTPSVELSKSTNERTMKASTISTLALAMSLLLLPACSTHKEEHHHEAHKIVATSPQSTAVTLTQQYVCQIRSQRHINIRALERGYLEAIPVKEGQKVTAGDVMFQVLPVLYKTKFDAESAKARVAQIKYDNTKSLFEKPKPVVSAQEVALAEAELAEANAKASMAKAELEFAKIKAPFEGIIDRLQQQEGSLVEEGEILTTLSDNDVMWVYFNVPEARYLEYMTGLKEHKDDLKIELVLANGNKFQNVAKNVVVEAEFNNTTGNIKFRADFPNPDKLLRHGQTGTVLISRVQHDVVVIPQRATFEVLDKRYVYVVDQDDVARQREIKVQNELEDIYVIKSGVGVDDLIVLEGARQIRDGDKVEYEDRNPEEVAANYKNHAE